MSHAIRRFDARDAAAVGEILASSPEAAAWSVNSLERLNLRGELGWVIEDENAGKLAGFLVVRAVVADYPHHARAARALSEEHFSSDRVLADFLAQAEL